MTAAIGGTTAGTGETIGVTGVGIAATAAGIVAIAGATAAQAGGAIETTTAIRTSPNPGTDAVRGGRRTRPAPRPDLRRRRAAA
jgi:hypothetical protein